MLSFEFTKKDFFSAKILAHTIWSRIKFYPLYHCNRKRIEHYDLISHLHKFDRASVFFEKHYHNVSEKTIYLGNAADDEFFENNGKTIKKKYIIYIGNYVFRKNQKMSLKCFYKSALPVDTELVLIGSQETAYYNELNLLKKQLDYDYGERTVKMLTGIPREKIPEYVKNADFYVMSSRWEAFPVSIVESMAAGVPFISTDCGITRHLPGGVVVQSEEEMIEWMEIFSKNEIIKNHYGQAGRKYAETYMKRETKINELEKALLEY